jgi:uncharacterized DUF497 family protein
MEFDWDETKSNACFNKRGFYFDYAANIFFDPDRLVEGDERHSYGEERYKVVGKIEDRIFVVIFTPRQDLIRIISARKANQREVQHYENSKNENQS